MITRQIIEASLGSDDPGRIREILELFHEIEDVLPDILGSTLHGYCSRFSQTTGELTQSQSSIVRWSLMQLGYYRNTDLYIHSNTQQLSAHTASVKLLSFAEISAISSGNDYLRIGLRTLPNVKTLWSLRDYRRSNRWDRTDCGINKLTGLVVSFTILYQALHDKPELTDVELAHNMLKLRSLQRNRSPNDPCEIALNRLKAIFCLWLQIPIFLWGVFKSLYSVCWRWLQ